jgi:hypothetical protein
VRVTIAFTPRLSCVATRVIAPPRAESPLRERSQARAEGERLLVEIFQSRKRRNDAAARIAAVIERLRHGTTTQAVGPGARTPDGCTPGPRRH